jgi:hypothetical protein
MGSSSGDRMYVTNSSTVECSDLFTPPRRSRRLGFSRECLRVVRNS